MRIARRARLITFAVMTAALLAPSGALGASLTTVSPPSISGTAQQGQTLHESHGTYANGTATVTPKSYTYQWLRCNSSGGSCAAISGAKSQTYTLIAADVGHTTRVQETAYTGPNHTGTSGSARSKATSVVTPSGGPKVTATTQPANGITTSSAVLHGVVSTVGRSVSWQFQFGEDANYNKGTPVQTIQPGKGKVSVKWKLIRLKPNTVYHYRLVATFSSGGKQTSTSGRDLTFTTNATGRLRLLSKRLRVTSKGFVSVPLRCASSLRCVAQYTITTTAKVTPKGGGTPAKATLVCSVKVARLKAGQRKTFRRKVKPACLGLLRKAKNHRLKAKFTTRPRTGQRGQIKKVILVLR